VYTALFIPKKAGIFYFHFRKRKNFMRNIGIARKFRFCGNGNERRRRKFYKCLRKNLARYKPRFSVIKKTGVSSIFAKEKTLCGILESQESFVFAEMAMKEEGGGFINVCVKI
ncbi:MAG: hypothetical protein ACR2P5_09785, partial [Gammaproteobacteria bacterium]